ncbi:hypothetical protein F4804DRAFT_334967 [Jackrogersella minutella]|nr:hypothetical protein F4804DRAFT_334967 [Jackrogersella minutella]
MYHQKILASLLALAATTSALSVPKGDGVWSVSVDANGNEVHELIQPLDPTIAEMVKRGDGDALFRRSSFPPGSSATCADASDQVSDSDWQAATANFKRACAASSGLLKNKQAILATSGGCTVYMCNYSSKGNPCSGDEFSAASDQIAASCRNSQNGSHQAGWFSMPSWEKTYGWEKSEQVC